MWRSGSGTSKALASCSRRCARRQLSPQARVPASEPSGTTWWSVNRPHGHRLVTDTNLACLYRECGKVCTAPSTEMAPEMLYKKHGNHTCEKGKTRKTESSYQIYSKAPCCRSPLIFWYISMTLMYERVIEEGDVLQTLVMMNSTLTDVSPLQPVRFDARAVSHDWPGTGMLPPPCSQIPGAPDSAACSALPPSLATAIGGMESLQIVQTHPQLVLHKKVVACVQLTPQIIEFVSRIRCWVPGVSAKSHFSLQSDWREATFSSTLNLVSSQVRPSVLQKWHLNRPRSAICSIA